MERIVVVGGGLAGARTVAELQSRGYTGRLTLVGAETRLPYDRPPLSKAVLRGELDDSTLELAYDDVELRLGERALALHDGVVETDRARLDFDGCVIATGSAPVPIPGALTLRTLDDAQTLRDQLRPGSRVAVVGAGWIGAELTTAALARGCRVRAYEMGTAPLAGVLGAEVGAATLPFWNGVDLHLGASVADGATLDADVVVAGIGARPVTAWAGHDGGVPVDAGLALRPGVYAVGDVAAWWSPRYRTRLRVEHWDNALHSPAVVAANLLGGAATYDPVPYFWSEQFGRMLQYAGWHGAADAFVWRGSPAAETWAGCWLRNGVLEAVVTCDRPRDLRPAMRVIAERGRPDLDRLRDPSVPLRQSLTR